MIGRLTGGVAHDFNNLLSAILGNLELARRRIGADSQIAGFLDNAMIGARRGAALVSRMMNFARQQDFQSRSIELPRLFQNLSDLLARAIGPETTIDADLPEHLPPINVDPHQLELAIMNLIINARDAMPTGGVIRVRARSRRIAAGPDGSCRRRYVQLEVIDTGIGMGPETLARAADIFFTTKPAGKGTGLGLSMVQGFVDAAQGQMAIESKPGRGTTVALLLPAAANTVVDHAAVNLDADDELENEDVLGPSQRKLRVLVIDDDALVLMNTATMLEDLGHQTVTMETGQDALDFLGGASGEAIDIVVTDHAMPKMTGLDFVRLARSRWPHLPMILATGYAEDAVETENIADARLQKPFSIRDLGLVIDEVARAHGLKSDTLDGSDPDVPARPVSAGVR
ncbi:ATP-binding protein [Jiella flava]|nr:ATP-binding protein [Jiella flava]